MAYETKETAAFNLATYYLARINSILNSNYTEFKNGNARAFAVNLKQLYRELYPWLKKDDKKNIDETKEFVTAFDKLAKIPKHKKEELWSTMENLENQMRAQFKQLGMLMPKVNDPRFLFGNTQK